MSIITIIYNNNLYELGQIQRIFVCNPATQQGRLALKYGKKYSYALENMDIKNLLVCSQPSKEITIRTST